MRFYKNYLAILKFNTLKFNNLNKGAIRTIRPVKKD